MISAEKISELIKHPHLAGTVKAEELLEIRDKFPYCSTLHLLYLKNLALANDVQFEDRLRYTAAHVMDRERMYYLVHSAGDKAEIVAAENSDAADKTTEQIRQVSSAATQEEKNTETIPAAIASDELQVDAATTVNEDSIAETILPSLVDKAYERALKHIEPLKEKDNEKEIPEQEHAGSATVVNKTADETSTGQVKHDKAQTGKETRRQIQADVAGAPEQFDLAKLSFVEWLRYKQSGSVNVAADKQDPEPGGKAEAVEKIPAGEAEAEQQAEETGQKNPVGARKNLSRTAVDDLLNKFITEEPSISRPKTEFFSPAKTARQSLEETPDLVTETLAKIYVLQKNYSKAIQAYEQLSLVYPEKKAFFADQIKKLKDDLLK